MSYAALEFNELNIQTDYNLPIHQQINWSDLRKTLVQILKFFGFFIIGVTLLWLAFRYVE
jgi:hypothetical protein